MNRQHWPQKSGTRTCTCRLCKNTCTCTCTSKRTNRTVMQLKQTRTHVGYTVFIFTLPQDPLSCWTGIFTASPLVERLQENQPTRESAPPAPSRSSHTPARWDLLVDSVSNQLSTTVNIRTCSRLNKSDWLLYSSAFLFICHHVTRYCSTTSIHWCWFTSN